MSIALGVVMDPIDAIKIRKDSTFAMLLEAQRRGWQLFYMLQGDLALDGGLCTASMRALSVRDDPDDWFDLSDSDQRPLEQLDVVLMRKDPPFDMDYVYTNENLAEPDPTLCDELSVCEPVYEFSYFRVSAVIDGAEGIGSAMGFPDF